MFNMNFKFICIIMFGIGYTISYIIYLFFTGLYDEFNKGYIILIFLLVILILIIIWNPHSLILNYLNLIGSLISGILLFISIYFYKIGYLLLKLNNYQKY